MSRAGRQHADDVLRAIKLPITDEAVDDAEDVDRSLLSIADSQVLLLSLRQSRMHHLSSLLPVFPVPKPVPKPKSKSKVKPAPPVATNTSGSSATPTTPVTPIPPPAPKAENPPWFPPFLLRALGSTHPQSQHPSTSNNISMRVGPMTFEGVTLWECRFDEKNLRMAGHPAVGKSVSAGGGGSAAHGGGAGIRMGSGSGEKGRDDGQRKGLAASQVGRVAGMPPPQIMRPNPPSSTSQQPRPSPSQTRPSSSPAPAIIHLVNLEASIHPWLATLIQRAARNLAGQEELKKLGQVVDILGRGKRLAPPVQGAEPVRIMPSMIRFVDGPPGSGPVSTAVGSVGQGQAQAQVQGQGSAQAVGRPTNGQGSRPPPIMVPPRPASLTNVQQTQQAPQALIGSPRLYPHLQRPVGSSTNPNTNTNIARHAIPGVRPIPQTSLPPIPSPYINRPPPPSQSQRPIPSPPIQQVSIPYIPPLLICSFRENPSEKFVIPIELSYISYEADKELSQSMMPMAMTGKMKVSTFLPSKGWGKWTFPENAKPSTSPALPPPVPIVDLTVSPTSADIPTKPNETPDMLSRKRKRAEHPLPLLTKPYTLGGVSIPPGPVQCVNIVFEGVGEKVWEVVKGLIREVEGEKQVPEAQKEIGNKPVEKETAVAAALVDEKAGNEQNAESEDGTTRLSRPKRNVAREVSGSESEVKGADSQAQTGSRKAQIFNTLLKRVPKREFLEYRIPSPVPKDYAIALGDPFVPVYRNVANKLPAEDFEDEVDVDLAAPTKKKKKRALSPTVTFELPMSFEGVEEAIVAQTAPPKKAAPKRVIVSRGPDGKACEGCGTQRKVWRIGPNGSGTLCFACGEKFQAGTLGKDDLVTTPQVSDAVADKEEAATPDGILVQPTSDSAIPAASLPLSASHPM